MPTKLSRYCEGILEAAWLLALILVPFFFNIYSSRIFEPDKITILRSLALIILVAWIIKLIDEGGIRWERVEMGDRPWKSLTRIPLFVPVVALAIIYIISTVFSVTPRISLWGSYQRLQGTYSTFSYIVVFAAILGNFRKRAQVDRLITVVILVSLPICLYGILQRYKIDPVPWGGDVSVRIAANMGNSIFVAAYLIMVFPLIIGRIIEAFGAILNEKEGLGWHVARATIYVFCAAVLLIALYFTGSRGPWLGWMAGSFFLFLLLSLLWRKRWMTLGVIGGTFILGLFLVVLNIPNGPLEGVRSAPGLWRLGQILSAESRTGQVRTLIWQGASELVLPHAPIAYPDGSDDKLNFLRPLIGYGPESMYVAYNPFYQPDLGHVEKRNASPDRSHNETWDSLVITGLLGLLVYFILFGAIFYYALKWIGLITGQRQRNLYLGFYLIGGVAGAVGMVAWRGIAFFGVGLPFGTILGLLGYLTLVAIFGSYKPPETPGERARMITLIILLAAIMSHFVEINFGIAIASTRTYFWVYTGLLLIVGYILPMHGEYGNINQGGVQKNENQAQYVRKTQAISARRRRKEAALRASLINQAWFRESMVGAALLTVVMFTFGYDYIANAKHLTSVVGVVWTSLTQLPNRDYATSLGILAMILTSWLAFGVIWVAETHLEGIDRKLSLLTILGVSLLLGLFYWLIHAGTLVNLAVFAPANFNDVIIQINRVGGLLTKFYFVNFLVLIGAAYFIREELSQRSKATNPLAVVASFALGIGVIFLISMTNLRIIHADIAFKMAEPFNEPQQWGVATKIYQYAHQLAPDEDHYYLFLGRSYLETAKETTNTADQDKLVKQSEADLKVAQKINPLNTDHTANLARLYSWWAGRSTDSAIRATRAETASDYYATALKLSPNNSTLWGEWAVLFMEVLRQPTEAYRCLTRALELDQEYNWTQGLMGDYFSRISRLITDTQEINQDLNEALVHYQLAYQLSLETEITSRLTYLFAIGNTYIQLDRLDDSIQTFIQAADIGKNSSDLWRIYEQISRLYAQKGDKSNALIYGNLALSTAPQDQQDQLDRIKKYIDQLNSLP